MLWVVLSYLVRAPNGPSPANREARHKEKKIMDALTTALESSNKAASSGDTRRKDLPFLNPVSYTHLTLPTICSV